MSKMIADYRAWLESMGAKKNTATQNNTKSDWKSVWEYIFFRDEKPGSLDELEVAVCLDDERSGPGDELFDVNVAKYLHGQPEGRDGSDVELLGLNRSQVASLLLILEVITSDVYFKAVCCDE